MALTAATSPSSFPQSSTGTGGCQQRACAIVPAHEDLQQVFRAFIGSLRIPKSSMISNRTVVSDSHELFARALGDRLGQIIQ